MKRISIFGRFWAVLAAALVAALTLAACGSDSSSGGESNSASASGSGSGGAAAAKCPNGVAKAGAPADPSAGATGTGTATLPTGTPGKGKPSVTLGSKDFSEQFVLGQLYKQALEARGYTVNYKENIGSSEIIYRQLTASTDPIDLYPEYTGVIYSNTNLANLGDNPKSATETYDKSKQFLESKNLTLLNPTPFQDADGVAVTDAFAAKYCLKTIADLKKVPSFTYAGPKENRNRYQGVLGLQKAYGLNNFQFKALPTGNQYSALDRGDVDSIAIFTTDAILSSGKYTVLPDTKGIFGYQQVAPLVKQSVLTQQGPEFAQTLNAVSELLTNDAIISMNKEVQLNQKKPADVAKVFLQANKIVS